MQLKKTSLRANTLRNRKVKTKKILVKKKPGQAYSRPGKRVAKLQRVVEVPFQLQEVVEVPRRKIDEVFFINKLPITFSPGAGRLNVKNEKHFKLSLKPLKPAARFARKVEAIEEEKVNPGAGKQKQIIIILANNHEIELR